MSETTREQFIATARRLFAERGFYGVSIAAIAEEVGLTKQALLHHFGNKEALYGEVLSGISQGLMEETAVILEEHEAPARRLEELIARQFRSLLTEPDAARLIMRELLDNERRAENAGNWYLKPYLECLVETAQAAGSAGLSGRAQALALVYQLLGAAHYFAVSQPTLRSIFGASLFDSTRACFEQELRSLVRSRL